MVDTDTRSVATSQNTSPSAVHFVEDGEGKGKVFFVGRSATLAFEEVVRRVVEDSIGSCAFTTDPQRSSMPEGSPGKGNKSVAFWTKAHIPALSVNEVNSLAACYHTSIHGICDLFESQILTREIHDWASQRLLETNDKYQIFLLVLAIGAQQRGQPGDQEIANKFFLCAQQLTLCYLNDETSLQTVQSHVLIALYMLNDCQRNGAFMNLGIAARAACTLGIHRNEFNPRFTSEESRARARAWKTLRVLDTFTSITLGRPPATSEPGSFLLWGRRPSDLSVEEQIDCACVRLCHISERIVGELYHQESVSIELVESISQHFREWATDLPALFEIDDNANDEFDPASLPRRLCLSHLSGAYYYCIIILTKTFLVEEIQSLIQKRSTDDNTAPINPDSTGSSSSSGAAFIVPCISSAIKSIDIAHSLTNYQTLPRRIYMVVNDVFISGLVLGVAYFGDYDQTFTLEEGFSKAIAFLHFAGLHDPHAQSCSETLSLLRNAVDIYVGQRDAQKDLRRKRHIDKMFGTLVGKWSVSQTLTASGDEIHTASKSSWEDQLETRDNSSDKSRLHDSHPPHLQASNLQPVPLQTTTEETTEQDLNLFSQPILDLTQTPADSLSPFSHYLELSVEQRLPSTWNNEHFSFEMI